MDSPSCVIEGLSLRGRWLVEEVEYRQVASLSATISTRLPFVLFPIALVVVALHALELIVAQEEVLDPACTLLQATEDLLLAD